MRKYGKIIIAVLLLSALTTAFTGCNKQKLYFAFGTAVNVKLDKFSTGVFDGLADLFYKLDADFDADNPESSVYKINNSAANIDIKITKEAYFLIEKAKKMYNDTDGAFNIATYPLTELWKFSSSTYNAMEKNYVPPTDEAVGETLKHCDIDALELRGNNTVVKTDSELKIGFGAIGKGFAGDEALKLFGKKGAEGLISLGGMIFTKGDRTFKIGVGNPRGDEDAFGALSLSGDYVVSTSGDYNRYYEVDGKRYHHIFAKDGKPADNGVISVTVILPIDDGAGIAADALSTAVFAMGVDDGSKYVMDNDLSAVIITKDKKYRLINLPDGADFSLIDDMYVYEEYVQQN